METKLTRELAERFALMTLHNVTREYPHVMVHVMDSDGDVAGPRQRHPIFFGCFDWHSCVHGYWQLARLIRAFPDLPHADAIRGQFDRAFVTENILGEIAYFQRPSARGFERPYGWAWLLALATELRQIAGDDRKRWHAALLPVANLIAGRLAEFLPKAVYPIRSGTHNNTAFAMTLSHAYAISHDERPLRSLIEDRVLGWYGSDAASQTWEPSLDDFLSPTLMEAACMQRIMPAQKFEPWLSRFLPQLDERLPMSILTPAGVTDRSDGKIAHLDGLNLSRAWCMRLIATALPDGDPRVIVLRESAEQHLAASLPHISDDYAGEHWLATFALLALL